MLSRNALGYRYYLCALLLLSALQQLPQSSAQPIANQQLPAANNALQQIPLDAIVTQLTPTQFVQDGSNTGESPTQRRTTRHIGGLGGGFVGGLGSTAVITPSYSVPVVQTVPVITTVPVISTVSTLQTVPSYATGYGYGGYGGYGAGGLIGAGAFGGYGKFRQSYQVKGFGVGGFGGGFLG